MSSGIEVTVEDGELKLPNNQEPNHMSNQEPKLSDTTLEALVRDSGRLYRSASGIEQFVRNALMVGGTLAALYIPLDAFLSTDFSADTSPPGQVTRIENHTIERPVPGVQEVIESLEREIGTHVAATRELTSQLDQMRERLTRIETAGASSEPNITLHTGTPTLHITSVPPSPNWHRAAFLRPGDQFWALPSADFRMTLSESAPCAEVDADDCTARFSVGVPGSTITIDLQPGNRFVSNAPDVCQPQAQNLPELECRVPSASAPSACVWLRRAPDREKGEEAVALEIRWLEWDKEAQTCQP